MNNGIDINKKKIFNQKIQNATKWSTITEIVAKLITPVTNMVLARLLAPKAFGVVATITMVVSFADMFTDAGFQRYLIQCEFINKDKRNESANIAFWTNFVISLVLFFIITIFSEQIALMVGNPGMGIVIIVASLQLPLTSFSSIQMALYKRNFNFKTLFIVRIASICIPIIITIPLAILGFNYWSLIIGNICGQLSNAVILTLKSDWKPSFFYKFSILKEMISFSIWTLADSILIWLTSWVDILIIGNALDAYHIGLYKTATSSVNGILSIVVAATTSVLIAALSRLQNDEIGFNNVFFKMQKEVAFLLIPMGIGIFLYRDVVTKILLGNKWLEASNIVGIWALISSIVIILSNYCNIIYIAKGKPKLSFISSCMHLLLVIPTCIISVRYGFWILVYSRSIIRLESIIVDLFLTQKYLRISAYKQIKNISKPFLCTLLMSNFAIFLKQISSNFLWSLISIVLCIFVYFICLLLFAKKDLIHLYDLFFKKRLS